MSPAMIAILTTIAALSGCAAAPPESPAAPPPPSAAAAAQPGPPAVKPAVPLVVRQFDKAHSQEVPAVFGPGVTAEQVTAISEAHRRAARALTLLGQQGAHPTAEARREADAAEKALEAAVAAAIH
jgi:hypothetical protein